MRANTHFISNRKSILHTLTNKRASALICAAVVLGLGFGSNHCQAQTPGAVDQVESVQQRRSMQEQAELRYDTGETAPELYPGESEDIGPQSVLAVKRRRTLVEGSADIQYYYTDNVFLDHTARIRSGVMVSTAQAELAPTPFKIGNSEFAPYVGFRQQWYDFFQYRGHNPSLKVYDFNAQTAFIGEEWRWKQNWQFGLGFDYTRLLTTESYRQFYSEYVPRWDATYFVPIGQKQLISLGYQGFYHFTHASQFQVLPQSEFFDRFDNAFLASFNWAPCDHVLVQPYYTFRYTRFTRSIHRDDYLNSVGIAGYYYFCKYFSARLFTSFDNRQSNVTQARYHEYAAGAGADVTFRF
ncbi:MAG TPA: hypothetical protein VFB72_12190 [Verrucomicrobiae bacterium]|nr:hypothetical protein [Verrucomicrobiae bacterium]